MIYHKITTPDLSGFIYHAVVINNEITFTRRNTIARSLLHREEALIAIQKLEKNHIHYSDTLVVDGQEGIELWEPF